MKRVKAFKRMKVEHLLGKTLKNIRQYLDNVFFKTSCGELYIMCHVQDCCEEVEIESIVGNLKDLIGNPLLLSEMSQESTSDCGSSTWTFYRFATIKGTVDIRWFGSSNGWYSEEVDFFKTEKKNENTNTAP